MIGYRYIHMHIEKLMKGTNHSYITQIILKCTIYAIICSKKYQKYTEKSSVT